MVMNIVVVSPHPDDETLGAGGTLLRQKARGDKIYWINVTNIDKKDGWDKRVKHNGIRHFARRLS